MANCFVCSKALGSNLVWPFEGTLTMIESVEEPGPQELKHDPKNNMRRKPIETNFRITIKLSGLLSNVASLGRKMDSVESWLQEISILISIFPLSIKHARPSLTIQELHDPGRRCAQRCPVEPMGTRKTWVMMDHDMCKTRPCSDRLRSHQTSKACPRHASSHPHGERLKWLQ